MALTAKFQADFTSFYTAVQKAQGSLTNFQKDADDVGTALDKMVDQFSGRQIIQDATNMAKAVKEIGSVANLTDDELRKIGKTVCEASDKMRKMGIEVPKDFQDITQAAEGVKEPTDEWASSLNLVKGGIAAIVSSGLVKFLFDSAKAGIEWAGSLSRMHAQTDISYKDLQILQDVAIETSTDMSTLTKSVQVLQERIGDKSAYTGLRQLGISVDAILKMNPAEQFGEVAKAIGKIEDPTKRAAAAKAILGNAYREALPAMRANWSEIAKNTKVVADDQIEAVDRLSAKWNKFWNDQDKSWGAWLGSQAKGLEEGSRQWDEAARRGAAARAKLFGTAGTEPTLPAAPVFGLPAGKDATTRDFDPTMISNIHILGQTLDQQTESVRKNSEEFKRAAAEQERFATAVTNSLERVRFTHYQMGAVAVAASQNVQGFAIRMSETVAINNDYTRTLTAAQIKTDSFGHSLAVNVMPSLQGVGGATYQAGLRATETASKQEMLNSRMDDITGILGGIQTGWAQMATVGARAIQGITNDFISGNWIGVITKATAALSGFIAKMISGSEESKKVSPIRDEFFRLQGGLETLNPKVQALTGNLTAVQAVFDAKTVQQYDAAIANLNKILAQEQAALDRATDSAEDYAIALKKIPTKIPINIDYSESGDVPTGATKGKIPGFATGTGGQFVDFGAGTLAMLHGREAIVPEGAVRSAAGGQGAIGGATTVVINAQGSFFDTPGDLQRLADKVNDALTAKYGLTNRLRAA
jgi:hypothetical protein